MARVPFDEQPDEGRLWVFAARAPLSAEAQEVIGASVDAFLDDWAAHGHALRASRDVAADRFLFVAVDPASEPPSGCSIDAMVRHLKMLEGEVGAELVAHGPVWYRDGEGGIRCVSRAEFRTLAAEGSVDLGTSVFDTTITEVGALRSGGFEVPARDSWHGFAFFR
jgi:hypothetical protein